MDRDPRRVRLDQLLLDRGLVPSRSQAHALVLAGRVRVGGRAAPKPGSLVDRDADVEVDNAPRRVSRGAAKLAAALAGFGIEAGGRVAIDIGASTGGFTQVLLEAGAATVVALDVGRGQLDWTLRNDPRVLVLDGVNARYLEPGALPARPALAVIDVSFISLRHVLPAVVGCLAEGGDIVALVKPQFEVGRGRVGSGGIVRDPALHREVLEELARDVAGRSWGLAAFLRSPITGAEGNVEFFLHLRPGRPDAPPATIARSIGAALAPSSRGDA